MALLPPPPVNGPPPAPLSTTQRLRATDFSGVPDYGPQGPPPPAVAARIEEPGVSAGREDSAADPTAYARRDAAARVQPDGTIRQPAEQIAATYAVPPLPDPPLKATRFAQSKSRLLRSDPSRPYKPYGGMEDAFYDEGTIVGLSGPAGTGKSRAFLEKLHLMCELFPGTRCLIVRKTRESLSEAALFTYETMVLPQGHVLLDGARRSHRQHYLYPNGSEIIVAGLDKPQKLMSTEFDIIYVQEAIECEQSDIEMLVSRLRNNVTPVQQLLFDCNPDKPTHWIWQGHKSDEDHAVPLWRLHQTWHEDNPTLWEEAPLEAQIALAEMADLGLEQGTLGTMWPDEAPDGRRGRWTDDGVSYRARLDMSTGARYKRLRLGLWVSAEGAVYEDEWKTEGPESNLIDWFRPPQHWRRVWSVDFGFTSPFVLQKWAIDPDGRAFMYEEIYYTRRLVSAHARQALETSGWTYSESAGYKPIEDVAQDPLPDYVVCDVDAEGRATFEEETGLYVRNAFKGNNSGIESGIQAVQKRMKSAGDGRPRLFVMRGSLVERDPSLKDAHKPQCTAEEMDGYVWDTSDKNQRKGERPLQKDDHGADCMRYMVCEEDQIQNDMKADEVPIGAGSGEASMHGMVVAVSSNRDRGTEDGRRREHVGNRTAIGGRGRRSRHSSIEQERRSKSGF